MVIAAGLEPAHDPSHSGPFSSTAELRNHHHLVLLVRFPHQALSVYPARVFSIWVIPGDTSLVPSNLLHDPGEAPRCVRVFYPTPNRETGPVFLRGFLLTVEEACPRLVQQLARVVKELKQFRAYLSWQERVGL